MTPRARINKLIIEEFFRVKVVQECIHYHRRHVYIKQTNLLKVDGQEVIGAYLLYLGSVKS